MSPTHQEFSDHPIAFFITFGTYGSWLHGDKRGSVDRFHNRYGTPRLPQNRLRERYERQLLKQSSVRLTKLQRQIVMAAIREICKEKGWALWAVNARSNHVHTVVSADCNSKKVRAALKARATKNMREAGYWIHDHSPWARRGSRKNLWTPQDVANAVAYVEYDQGE
jgi:REP element-mobilizing transposase RayT